MARVKRGVTSKAKHKKVLKKTKGQYGARSRLFKVAKQAAIKLVNTPIGIDGKRRDSLDHFGLLESMLLQDYMIFHTAN